MAPRIVGVPQLQARAGRSRYPRFYRNKIREVFEHFADLRNHIYIPNIRILFLTDAKSF